MCEVCAVFGVGEHWVDTAPVDEEQLAARGIQGHRSVRARRLRLLNVVVAPRGVRIIDWDGEAYCVEDSQGRSCVVPDLSSLWRDVERMSGRLFDPLARDFLPGIPKWSGSYRESN
jgi:hypothetical protein